MDEDAIDFVVAAWREDGHWQVSRLPQRTGVDNHSLISALSAHPADNGVVGLVSVAEDFFVVARTNRNEARFLLSDVSAALDWPLASQILEEMQLPLPDEDDLELDEPTPAGDLTLLQDLGMGSSELAILSEDVELYPDEVLTPWPAGWALGASLSHSLRSLRKC
jgi:putative tRNA adenosine deaminase-associated protein